MNKLTKIAAVSAAALTLVVGTLATSTQAEAKWKGGWGPAIGLGIAAGVIGGAAYAATYPGYYVGGPVGCRWVARYDSWGNYRGSVKVCDLYSDQTGQEFRSIGASAPFHPRADCIDPPGQSPSERVVPFPGRRPRPTRSRDGCEVSLVEPRADPGPSSPTL